MNSTHSHRNTTKAEGYCLGSLTHNMFVRIAQGVRNIRLFQGTTVSPTHTQIET